MTLKIMCLFTIAPALAVGAMTSSCGAGKDNSAPKLKSATETPAEPEATEEDKTTTKKKTTKKKTVKDKDGKTVEVGDTEGDTVSTEVPPVEEEEPPAVCVDDTDMFKPVWPSEMEACYAKHKAWDLQNDKCSDIAVEATHYDCTIAGITAELAKLGETLESYTDAEADPLLSDPNAKLIGCYGEKKDAQNYSIALQWAVETPPADTKKKCTYPAGFKVSMGCLSVGTAPTGCF